MALDYAQLLLSFSFLFYSSYTHSTFLLPTSSLLPPGCIRLLPATFLSSLPHNSFLFPPLSLPPSFPSSTRVAGSYRDSYHPGNLWWESGLVLGSVAARERERESERQRQTLRRRRERKGARKEESSLFWAGCYPVACVGVVKEQGAALWGFCPFSVRQLSVLPQVSPTSWLCVVCMWALV